MKNEPVRVVSERVVLDESALQELRQRLASVRVAAVGTDTMEQGVPRAWLQELLDDWRCFDTDALQHRLDRLSHLRVQMGGHSLHVLHAPGRGTNPVPFVLTHGWQGSFLEHPSLPGFGFSGPPPKGRDDEPSRRGPCGTD